MANPENPFALQLALLTLRTAQAEIIIDELKKIVPLDTFDTIATRTYVQFASHSQPALQKCQEILKDYGFDVDVATLLRQIPSKHL
jgi:hypothetical protein